MSTAPGPVVCPACGQSMAGHWMCQCCRCFGHKQEIARYSRSICTDCERSLAKRRMRYCESCGKVKPLTAYPPHPRRQCAACVSDKRAARYAANREHERAVAKAHTDAHRKEKRQRDSRYYYDNHETILARKRAYYARNREKVREYHRMWRHRRRKQLNQYNREYHQQHRERLLARKRARAAAQKFAILQKIREAIR